MRPDKSHNTQEETMRKVYVNVAVRLIINIDEGVEVSEVIDEMDYSFKDTTGKADIIDTEIRDHEVTDSK
jgi:hypothetical protein